MSDDTLKHAPLAVAAEVAPDGRNLLGQDDEGSWRAVPAQDSLAEYWAAGDDEWKLHRREVTEVGADGLPVSVTVYDADGRLLYRLVREARPAVAPALHALASVVRDARETPAGDEDLLAERLDDITERLAEIMAVVDERGP